MQVPCIIVSATTVGQTDDFCASRLSAAREAGSLLTMVGLLWTQDV